MKCYVIMYTILGSAKAYAEITRTRKMPARKIQSVRGAGTDVEDRKVWRLPILDPRKSVCVHKGHGM
jgi:hypothetical protein